MAFLCPVRIRRGKKKKPGVHNFNLEKDCVGGGGTGLGLGTKVPLPPGRITGSASIETLVRVGIEKENGLSPDSKMVIVHDFTPCVDDELQVKRGQDPSAGRYIVLYTFVARDENDVSVERGEFVTVLNRDDPDWFWVLRHCDGNEGFVPSGFVYPGHVLHSYATTTSTTTTTTTAATTSAETHSLGKGNSTIPGNESLQQKGLRDFRDETNGTELVVLYDYKAQAPDDLSVRRADWIYADLGNQTVDGWLWAYAPKTRKYGFIPKAYARPPAMTSL